MYNDVMIDDVRVNYGLGWSKVEGYLYVEFKGYSVVVYDRMTLRVPYRGRSRGGSLPRKVREAVKRLKMTGYTWEFLDGSYYVRGFGRIPANKGELVRTQR